MWNTPVTCSLLLVCGVIGGFVIWRSVDVSCVSVSYAKVVLDREYWRLGVGPFVHGDVIQLCFMLMFIWSNRFTELYFGSLVYVKQSLVILVCSSALNVGWIHWVTRKGGVLQGSVSKSLQSLQWFGYSGVLFGSTMVYTQLEQWSDEDTIWFLSLFPVPIDAAVFVFFCLTQIIVWKSSAMNHVFGIFAGYLVSVGIFEWLTPYFTCCLVGWCLVLLFVSRGFPPKFVSEEEANAASAVVARVDEPVCATGLNFEIDIPQNFLLKCAFSLENMEMV